MTHPSHNRKKKTEKHLATCVVHWPTGPVNCCDYHAKGLLALANILGLSLTVTKLTDKSTCSNCINEAKIK